MEQYQAKSHQPNCSRTSAVCVVNLAAVGVVGALFLTLFIVAFSTWLTNPSHGTTDLWKMYDTSLRRLKHVDLTHAIGPNVPLWDGFGPPQFAPGTAGKSMDGFVDKGEEFTYSHHGFVTTRLHLGTDQMGTQLDPPAHWNEFGATLSDIPATYALRPLVVIDVSSKVQANPGYTAVVEDVLDWERRNGKVPEGSVVMFRTDYSRKWNEYKTSGLPHVFPSVGLDALKFLHLQRNILFHGHEPLDTDATPSLEGEAWLMHNNFAQAEGVTNLWMVPEKGALLSIGFSKIQGGTGAYARFVALCPADWPHGQSMVDDLGAPLQKQKYPLRRNGQGVMVPKEGASPTHYCKDSNSLGCPLPQ